LFLAQSGPASRGTDRFHIVETNAASSVASQTNHVAYGESDGTADLPIAVGVNSICCEEVEQLATS